MRKALLPLAAAMGLLAGCAADKDLKTTAGYPYTLDQHKEGTRKAAVGDLLTFHVVYRTQKDSVLGSTYLQGAPYTIPLDTSAGPGQPKDPFFSCYMTLAEGDSARFMVPSDSLFKGAAAQSRPPFLPPGSKLKMGMKALRIESPKERDARVAKELTDFATKDNMVEKAGIYVKTERAGTGPLPVTGDTLLVNYTGTFADALMGTKPFDSSVNPPGGRPAQPFKMVLKTRSVVPGWDSAFSYLQEGSKARILIPFLLAYGPQGNPGGIPPYSNLFFDVELLKVIKPVAAKK